MKLAEAKQQFISSWGAFGTHWGINRTMAQIHALLLINPEPLTQDDIMEELDISRGNTNMNIRELINWGLVERVLLTGERKEYFSAEKDIWKVVKQIVKERKKRELEPMLQLLDKLEAGTTTIDTITNTLILMPSAELSRARGGFHCMSMPLERDPVA